MNVIPPWQVTYMKNVILAILTFGLIGFYFTSVSFSDSSTSAKTPNEGLVEIDNPEAFDQVVAISDVHGMYQQLVSLLSANKLIDTNHNWAAGKTLLVVVGDSIDKGPEGLDVLNLWIELSDQASKNGGRVLHLLGNHEAELLAYTSNDPIGTETINEAKAQGIDVKELVSADSKYGSFIRSEPLAARVGKWLFCHAGYFVNETLADLKQQSQSILNQGNYSSQFIVGDNSILEARVWEKDQQEINRILNNLTANNLFGVVFGHQPKAFKIEGRSASVFGGRIIKIDNGMPPEAGSHDGSLLVFTNPGQMKNNSYPNIVILDNTGASTQLQSETISDL